MFFGLFTDHLQEAGPQRHPHRDITAPMVAGKGAATGRRLRGLAGDVADAALCRPSTQRCAVCQTAPAARRPPAEVPFSSGRERDGASGSFVCGESTPRRERRVFRREMPTEARNHGEDYTDRSTARPGRVCGSWEGGSARAKAIQPLQREASSPSTRERTPNRREKSAREMLGATSRSRLIGGLSQVPAYFLILIAMATAQQIPDRIEILRSPFDAPARQVFGSQPQVCLLLLEGSLDWQRCDFLRHGQVRMLDLDRTVLRTREQILVTPIFTDQPLVGTTTLFLVDGLANFTDLAFMEPATNVKLRFSCVSCEDLGSSPLLIEKSSDPFSIQPALHSLVYGFPQRSDGAYEHPIVAGAVSVPPCVLLEYESDCLLWLCLIVSRAGRTCRASSRAK